MALIKCPECEKEVSDKANNCPNCGCPILNSEQPKKKKNIRSLFVISMGVIVLVIVGIFASSYIKKSPAREAMSIISEDKSQYKVVFDKVYYNKKENACVVYFSIDHEDDIGVVKLDTRKVGYKNLYEITSLSMLLTTNEEQKLKIAEGIIADAYDPVYVKNVVNGNNSWQQLYGK